MEHRDVGLHSCGNIEICDYTAVGIESCKTIYTQLWEQRAIDYTAVGTENYRLYTAGGTESYGTIQLWEQRAIDYTQLGEQRAIGIYKCGNREL